MKLGPVSVTFAWWSCPRPYWIYENQGPDFHFFALSFGNRVSDPVVSIDINLGSER